MLARLQAAGHTLAVAESLTGGLLAAALTDIPGSSASFRGGVVSYATELKASLLGVDAAMLARHGAVYPPVAAEMAAGVRTRLGASHGLATTGVAGPDPADGQPVGTVHIAVSDPGDTVVRTLVLSRRPAGDTYTDGRGRPRSAIEQAGGRKSLITALRWERTRGDMISQTYRSARYGGGVGGSALGRECGYGSAPSAAG